VLLLELHNTRPSVLISDFKGTFRPQRLEAQLSQNPEPFVTVGQQSCVLDHFQPRQARAFFQAADQQASDCGSIHSRQQGELKHAYLPNRPPGRRRDKAFDRPGSHRRQQSDLGVQVNIPEQMHDSLDFSGRGFADRDIDVPDVVHLRGNHGSLFIKS
jgi:hypothetical protein